MTEPKPDPPIEPITGDEARAMLLALYRADRKYESCREQWCPEHDAAHERWKRKYQEALAMGAQIEGVRPSTPGETR